MVTDKCMNSSLYAKWEHREGRLPNVNNVYGLINFLGNLAGGI